MVDLVANGGTIVVDHEANEAQHGGTAIVSSMVSFGLLAKVVSAKVDLGIAELLIVGSFGITPKVDMRK